MPTNRTKEAGLRRRIQKKLEASEPGSWWYHPHGGPYGVPGLPDLIGCWQGRFVGFEVKVPGGPGATPLQLYTLERIKNAGGIASVIRSFEEAKSVLDSYRDPLVEAGETPPENI